MGQPVRSSAEEGLGAGARLAFWRSPAAIISESLALLVVAFAASPLFLIRTFATDWSVHTWTIAYFRDFFLRNGGFPDFLNTTQWAGNPQPLFYGYAFYPLFGVLSASVPYVNTFILWACAAALLIPYLFWRALLRCVLTPVQAPLASLMISCSVYQLTNLYTRSALTEFFAAQAGLIAVAALALALIERRSAFRSWLWMGSAALALMWAVGFHPITGVIVVLLVLAWGVVLPFVSVPTLRLVWRARLPIVAAAAVLVVCLAGWAGLTVQFMPEMVISDSNSAARMATNFRNAGIAIEQGVSGLLYFPFDSLFYRLFPYPEDPRILAAGVQPVSTPFLTAPIGLGATVAVFGLAFAGLGTVGARYRRGIILAAIAACAGLAVLVAMSSLPQMPGVFPFISNLQFAYRLVNFCNLWIAAFAAVLVLILAGEQGASATDRGKLSISPLLFGVCLGVSGLAIGGKVLEVHAAKATLKPPIMLESELVGVLDRPRETPRTFYGLYAYSSRQDIQMLDGDVAGRIDLAPSADLRSATAALPQEACTDRCIIGTNILPSRLVEVSVEGGAVSNRLLEPRGTLALEIKGPARRVSISSAVNPLSAAMRSVGLWAGLALFVVICAGWAGLAGVTLSRLSRRRGNPVAKPVSAGSAPLSPHENPELDTPRDV